MKKFLKILIIFFAVLIILFIGSYIFVRLTLNEKQIRTMAENSLSQVLNRDVELGRIRIRLGWGVKIEILDVRVANEKGFSPEPMLSINTTQLTLLLPPLLKRQIVIDEITLREMRLLIERNPENQLNMPKLSTPAKAPADSQKTTAWHLALNRIEIKDGRVEYRDSLARLKVLMSNTEQEMSLSPESIRISGASDLEVFPANANLGTIYLNISNLFTIDPSNRRFVINALNITMPPNTISVTGVFNNYNDLDLKGKIHFIEIDRIIAYLNRELAEKLRIKGELGADFSVTGPTDNIDFKGQAELGDLTVSYQPAKMSVEKIYGGFNFSRHGLNDIKINGKVGNINLKINGNIDSLASPLFNVNVELNGNLTELNGSYPEIEKYGLAGNTSAKLQLLGSLKNLRYLGNVKVANGQLSNIGLAKPVTDVSLNCDIKNDLVNINELTGRLGESDISVKGKIIGFQQPKIELAANSNRFNLDEILVPKKGSGNGAKPANFSLKAELNAANLTFFSIPTSKAKGKINYETGKLSIRSTSFDAYDGQVIGEADFDFTKTPVEHRINVTIINTEAKMLLKQFARFDALSGKMSGKGEFKGTGFSAKEMKANFNAQGHAAFHEGSFVNFNFITKLISWLALGETKTVNFRDLGTEFKIQHGRVRLDDFTCATTIGEFLLFGTVGFDGDIDYKINLILNKETSGKFKSLRGDWLFYTDEHGQIMIDILATGNLSSPHFKLDTEKIKNRLEKKAGGEIKKKIEETKKKIKDWLRKR